jgi:hypothetical protein
MSRLHENPAVNGRTHRYHADATVLSGNLHIPLPQKIEPQAKSHLYHQGGYLSQHATEYRVEGVLSFQRAYSQVAGHPSRKPGRGWSTLSTTVVEGLNVLEVLTADRVVGQIITEHPLDGYVPHISFLGTRIENLRIAGHPVELEWDLNILGERQENDHAYSKHEGVLEKVKNLVLGMSKAEEHPEVAEQYNRLSSNIGSSEAVECSLVKQVKGCFPGFSFGNIIRVPDFGTIELAKLSVCHEQFGAPDRDHNPNPNVPELTTVTLTMIDLKLGCAIEGDVPVGTGTSNGGTTKPGGG